MDIKEKVEEIVKKLQADPDLLNSFKADPVKALENLAGIDIPAEEVQKVVEMVTAKLGKEHLTDKLKEFLSKL